MKSYVLLAGALLANSVFVSSAFADQMVTLPDGKQVLLKDDFTWQYVAENKTEEFDYTATKNGKNVEGTVKAKSKVDAEEYLANRGLTKIKF